MPYKDAEAQKAYQRAYQKKWRQNPDNAEAHKKLVRARNEELRKANSARVRKLKSYPCADCGGIFDPVCMDFDHLPGTDKVRNIAAMLAEPWERIQAEIDKCELVCSNCHRVRTHIRTHSRFR